MNAIVMAVFIIAGISSAGALAANFISTMPKREDFNDPLVSLMLKTFGTILILFWIGGAL